MLEAFVEIATDSDIMYAIGELAPTGLGAVLVWVLNRVVSPVVDAAKAVTSHFEQADDHRAAEEKHWKREEDLLEEIAGHFLLHGDPAGAE